MYKNLKQIEGINYSECILCDCQAFFAKNIDESYFCISNIKKEIYYWHK